MHNCTRQSFNSSMQKSSRHNQGFSLVELIVVILIIGILAGFLAPAVIKYRQKSVENSVKYNINQLISSIDIAYAAVGTDINPADIKQIYYPTTLDGHFPTGNTASEQLLVDSLTKTLPPTADRNYFIYMRPGGRASSMSEILSTYTEIYYYPDGNPKYDKKKPCYVYYQGKTVYNDSPTPKTP